MAELFHRDQPKKALQCTGERYVAGISERMEGEHLHRYFIARELCRGKEVLDVASGEGYGSAFLAQTAKQVIGIDKDPSAIAHAGVTYEQDNVKFIQADATALPLDASSIDVVVSFETLEYLANHQAFFDEIRRVLRPAGLLIISIRHDEAPNPFHVQELTEQQFEGALKAAFQNVVMLRQRPINGSVIFADRCQPCPPSLDDGSSWIYEKRNTSVFEASAEISRWHNLIALASDAAIAEAVGPSLYFEQKREPVNSEPRRHQEAEAAGNREGDSHNAATKRERSEDHLESHPTSKQSDLNSLLLSQQALVIQRLHLELNKREHAAAEGYEKELEVLQSQLDDLRTAYEQLTKLVVPIWLRKCIPGFLRSPARAVKRVLRHG